MFKKSIPTLITLLNLACGFLAIVLNQVELGSYLILLGMLLDTFDGWAARKLNVESEIGKQLDSLADIITFGAAPAYLYLQLAPDYDYFMMIPSVIYVMASAYRLAKFNTLPSKKTFTGLATPAGALFLIGILLSHSISVDFIQILYGNVVIYFIIPIVLALLLNSNIEMFSLKSLERPFHKNIFHIITLIVFIISVVIAPTLSPTITIFAYILLSIIENLLNPKTI